MADINIERKSGTNWLWWIIGLIVLALLIWWLVSLFDEPEVAEVPGTVAPVTAPVGPPGDAGLIGEVNAVLDAPDQVALAGRGMQLTNVNVPAVTGDNTFWVGPSMDRALFVVLDPEAQAGGPVEGKVNVNEGQTVTVEGVLRPMPQGNDFDPWAAQYGLDRATIARLRGAQVYLAAENVNVTQGAQQ